MAGIVVGPTGARIEKDPDDVLDYILDFTDWLSGATLDGVTIVQSTGVVVDSFVTNSVPLVIDGYGTIDAAKSVVLVLSGGAAGVGGRLTVRITSGGLQRDASYTIVIKPR